MKVLLKQLKNGLTVTRQTAVKGLTDDENDVYSALFVAPTSNPFENMESLFYSEVNLDDLIRLTELTKKEIKKSLKGLIKKKFVEYDEETGNLTLSLMPNLIWDLA